MPRSPGGRLDPGRIVGARLDWSGTTHARESRTAARNSYFGIGVVGSYGSYRQPQFFPLQAADTLGTTTVLDSFTDASAPRDLPTYNPAWSAPAFGGELTPKTTPAGTVTGVAGGTSGAYYPSVSQADVRVFATVAARPADGNVFELLARLQNPGGAQNCYALVAFANAGTDSIELYQFTAGAGTFLGVFQAADYSAGDTFALDISGVSPFTVATAYKNGVQIGTVANLSFVNGAGSVGVRLQDTVGELDDFGIGSGTHDAATRALLLPRTVGDTLGSSDAATRAATIRTRTASDSLGTSDAAVVPIPRTSSDTLGTSDAATRTSAQPRTAADSLGSTDAAARAPLTRTRTATDSLGASTYDPTIDVDSPVSHWKLGGATTAVDRKGTRDLPVTSGSVATSPGLVANNGPDLANAFDSTNSFRRTFTPNDGLPYNTATWSIEAWVKPSVIATRLIVSRSGNYELRLNAGGINSYNVDVVNNSSVQVGVSAGFNSAVVGQTTHVVATYDGTNLIIYTDGIERQRKPATNQKSLPDEVPAISGGDIAGITGVIDEVAWYPSALSAARILAHYQAGTVPVLDAATRAVLLPRVAADTLGTSDAAVAIGGSAASRTAADSLGTSDAATRTTAQPRAASDTLAASTYDPVIDADSPVSHWKLGSASSAVDRKGVTDLPAVSGPISAAATLVVNNGNDVSNRFVRASSQLFGKANSSGQGAPYEAPSWSVEAWLSPASSPGTTVGVVGRDSHQTIRLIGTNAIQLRWRDAADFADAIGTAVAVVGTTYHVVGVFDGTNAILYVNGVENARKATSSRSIPDGVPSIASQGFTVNNFFDGTVDEVGWYTTALSPARVLAHYQAGTVPAPIDVATRALALPRVAADSLGTSDAAVATTSGVPSRTASDALGTSDAATRGATVRTRTASDSVGTSDVAARAPQSFARTGGYGAAQLDNFNSDSRANYTISGGALSWSGSSISITNATQRWVNNVWPLANDASRISVKARCSQPGSASGFGIGVGFTVAAGTLTQALGVRIDAGSRVWVVHGDLIGGGPPAHQEQVGTVSPGLAASTYYVLRFTRQGNSYLIEVLDSTGTSTLFTFSGTLLAGNQAAYGAGVSLRPGFMYAEQSGWGGTTEYDDLLLEVADALGTSDVATRSPTLRTRTASDALGTSDAATRATTRTRTATDSLGTSDAAAAIASPSRSATDSLGTSDAATRAAVVRARMATDALGTSDAAARTLAQPRTAGDTLATSDAATRTATVRVRTAVDTLGTSDVAVRVVSRPRTASDALATSDAATRAATVRIRSGTDTLGTSDLAFVGSSPLRSAADALGTSDAATRAPTIRARSASDVLASSDAATRTATVRSRSASDTLGTSDVARSAPFRTASDALGTSDAATRTSLRTRTSTDTLGTSDAATRAAGAGARSAADVLGTSDLATRSATYVRFSADLLGSSDVAVVAPAGFGRFASDTLGTSDQPERVLVSYRFAADELGTTDTAVSVLTRFASDTLGTSDVATIVVAALVIGTVLVTDSSSALLSISDSAQLELALSSSALTIFDEPA